MNDFKDNIMERFDKARQGQCEKRSEAHNLKVQEIYIHA